MEGDCGELQQAHPVYRAPGPANIRESRSRMTRSYGFSEDFFFKSSLDLLQYLFSVLVLLATRHVGSTSLTRMESAPSALKVTSNPWTTRSPHHGFSRETRSSDFPDSPTPTPVKRNTLRT